MQAPHGFLTTAKLLCMDQLSKGIAHLKASPLASVIEWAAPLKREKGSYYDKPYLANIWPSWALAETQMPVLFSKFSGSVGSTANAHLTSCKLGDYESKRHRLLVPGHLQNPSLSSKVSVQKAITYTNIPIQPQSSHFGGWGAQLSGGAMLAHAEGLRSNSSIFR